MPAPRSAARPVGAAGPAPSRGGPEGGRGKEKKSVKKKKELGTPRREMAQRRHLEEVGRVGRLLAGDFDVVARSMEAVQVSLFVNKTKMISQSATTAIML